MAIVEPIKDYVFRF